MDEASRKFLSHKVKTVDELAHVPAKWIRFADKDMRQHKNLRRFQVISDHRVIRYDLKAL